MMFFLKMCSEKLFVFGFDCSQREAPEFLL